MRTLRFSAALAAATVLGCTARQTTPSPTPGDVISAATPSTIKATAVVRSAAGRELGTVLIADDVSGWSFTGTLRGLPPGTHGIHLHAVGQCDAPTFETAGAHWNPTTRQHGTKNSAGPHQGDLPNITVAADSTVVLSLRVSSGTLRGASAMMDADGASLVVHAAADDELTDPSGNTGARIACGVIQGA